MTCLHKHVDQRENKLLRVKEKNYKSEGKTKFRGAYTEPKLKSRPPVKHDESKIELVTECPQYITRHSGERYEEVYAVKTVKHRPFVMI
ncbi:hypothetical protein Trydic_g22457 [Trypoxylus dichotomus]